MQIFFNVNGKDIRESNVDPQQTLAYYLRNNLNLRGTKLGCEEGVCGSCTVVLSTWNPITSKANYNAVNACLVPLFHVHRSFIITIEGISNPQQRIHPIQDRLARGHGAQCGFCSPGFVMSAYALLRNNPEPTIEQINRAVQANLCRCTGYRPILEALQSFGSKGNCCGGKINGKCCSSEPEEVTKLTNFEDFPKYDPSQEIIFPPSLILYQKTSDLLHFQGKTIELYMPQNLESLKNLDLKSSSKVISSGLITRLISASNFKKETWISIKYVEEFNEIGITDDWITVGSGNSLKTLIDNLTRHMKDEEIGKQIGRFFGNYSSPQVFNFASWVGSILSGAKSKSSVSDLLVLLMVMNPKFEVINTNSKSSEIINLPKLLSSNDIIVMNIRIDRNIQGQLKCLKLGESAENDSTVLNFSSLDGKCFIGLGGIPEEWDGIKYKDVIMREDNWKSSNREHFKSLQLYTLSKNTVVGRPIANYYNERTVTGEALFVNDIGNYKNGLHLGFVVSTVPHANIISVDYSEAMNIEGVHGYLDIRDVPGDNQPALSVEDLPDDTKIFADGKVESVGQIIGAIAANDVVLARRAAKLVKVQYETLPNLIDFREAIEKNSFHGKPQHYGDDIVKSDKVDNIYEGDIHIGGQEHYYLETQNSLTVPGESGEIVVHCSTQGTSFTQLMLAKFLNLPAHKIIVKTKRLGGAFGGKVSNAAWIACISALASQKFKCPVYASLSRQEDLQITGKRHEAFAKYQVGVDKNGKVEWCHYRVWLNGGWSIDHTEMVLLVMGIKIDDVYNMGNVRFDGYPIKTNTCSNTAFRGYGTPQGKLINDGIMRRIGWELNKNVEKIKEINLMEEGGLTFLGNKLHSFKLRECWEECKELSDFENREKEIEEFNKSSKTVKRGITMSAVRFGLPHPGAVAHGIASLLINLDGSIQLSIGGTEMGQGLNMKMLQICSEKLNRPIDTITIIDSSTDKITNAPETGGSQNTDTNGLAVIACCDRIMKGLAPILEKNEGNWVKSIKEAHSKFVPLQCTEYGVVDRQKFGVDENDNPYSTTGACSVEIEVDSITGYNRLIRVDIVMDIGESINPAIDIGQIEGAFMQAYGYVTCEKLKYDKKTGRLEQAMPGKYKIPKSTMVPEDFRIKLLGINTANNAQVYSSKGIGEPPLIMSCGACHCALMKCIDNFRLQNGLSQFVETVSPLSSDLIRNLCKSKD